MGYSREMPWYELGTKLSEPATAEEAIRASGLDWQVVKKEMYSRGECNSLPSQIAAVREDLWNKNGGGILGTVNANYEPLQNIDSFSFFDPIVKMGAAFYDSAGALEEGKCVWVMVRLRGNLEIASNDEVAPFLLLTVLHGDAGPPRIGCKAVRLACKNTLPDGLLYPLLRAVRRSAGPPQLEMTPETALEQIQRHFYGLANQFRSMLEIKMNKEQAGKYFQEVFPEPHCGKDEARNERASVQHRRDLIECARLFAEGMGNDLPHAMGTLWAAQSAVAEYVDFYRTKHDDPARLNDIWSSTPKSRALISAIKMIRGVRS